MLNISDNERSILITGGAGFIGSHLVRLFVNKYPRYHIINVDSLTYAGNPDNLRDVEGMPNYTFVRADICDFDRMKTLMEHFRVDGIIHLAAESHVDRSIKDPFTFARTNVLGTLSLLEAARQTWTPTPESDTHPHSCGSGYRGPQISEPRKNTAPSALKANETSATTGSGASAPEGEAAPRAQRRSNLFYHISTDEVYGSLPPLPCGDEPGEGSGRSYFTESTKYDPHSPYSASKASSDHFVRAYHDTYGMPAIVTNCSNNYGPYQFPEKLIPLFINNIRLGKPLPVYGRGENVRDWLYVEDHVRAIDLVFHRGRPGETYNIGGFNEWRNIDLVKVIIRTVDRLLGRPEGHSDRLITYVTDRPGHDLRYAIDSSKLRRELGWEPGLQFEEGIEKTVRWYLDNPEWTNRIVSGEYRPDCGAPKASHLP